MKGIKAVAGGMIAVAAIILMQASGLEPLNWLIMGATVLILASRKVPAPLLVVLALLTGVLF